MKSAWGPPRPHAISDPVRSLANIAIFPSFAGCWCGVTRVFFSFGLPPNRRGGVAVTPSAVSDEIADQGMFRRFVSGVGGPPMFTEFQLWVLGAIVMFAVVIVSVKLPG